jgi:hypothetical protein
MPTNMAWTIRRRLIGAGRYSGVATMTADFVSRRDNTLAATVVKQLELFYTTGPNRHLDRPAHVRAGSGLAWFDGRIAVIQDDANFIALLDPHTGLVDALTLPSGARGLRQFDEQRGNKRDKFDFEACCIVIEEDTERLLVLGSGSGDHPAIWALIDNDYRIELVNVATLYDQLKTAIGFSGSELNIEGAVWLQDGWLRLLNRGDGAAHGALKPCNASCDLQWSELSAYLTDTRNNPPPSIHHVRGYELGDLDGARLTFTDAMPFGSGILYTAAAEDAPDSVNDGEVFGSALGLLDSNGNGCWIEVRDVQGAVIKEKIEGICAVPGHADRVYLVVDADDFRRPSLFFEAILTGEWY